MKVKRRLAGCLVVLALVAVTVIAGSAIMSHYRPTLKSNERYGIDVSSHQGAIDWSAVAADNIEFSYIKATEGGDFIDRSFQHNAQEAKRAGLDIGAYHFFTLCADGNRQADNFLKSISAHDLTLAPAVDLEIAGNCKARPTIDEIKTELLAFVSTVERVTSQPILVYMSDDFRKMYKVDEYLPRQQWKLKFMRRPSGSNWKVWQVTGFARVDGIEGRVDLDVMKR